VIGDSAHAASINLHAAAGFVRVGTLRSSASSSVAGWTA
jgi:L-amino acid N-acyltransferase YncA